MLIINTGGTFNKRYDPIKGDLYVPQDNEAVDAILSTMNIPIRVQGILFKDSLEMDDQDRERLTQTIQSTDERLVVIVHGTDTIDQSAHAIAMARLEKVVVLTGAMVPFSVDPVEAAANLALAIGFARSVPNGVYIAMQGITGLYTNVGKNREAGKFEYV